MSSQFQNRLVGIIVLVALGVIFLPDILDGKKQHQEEQFAEIPLRPVVDVEPLPQSEFETIELAQQQSQQSPAQASGELATDEAGQWQIVTDDEPQTAEASSAKPKAQTDNAKPATQTAPKTAEPKPVQPKATVAKASAYTIQLGSFNNANNVKALVKQLRGKGFTAYTIPEKPVDGQLTKVFVGPDLSRVKLEKVQKQVEQVTKLKGRVIAYNPTEK
ncbi:cell division protein DedD [Shewanella waksmanii]|uniref:cell division protein DedD n=1 Tax=Shewanella waksmanii TaxID=213783 RepID=UPI00048C5EE7|nr:cell division protein DedD [Shewanella waksmanii]